MICTRCNNTGFLNIEHVAENVINTFDELGDHNIVLDWILEQEDTDACICDCCGNTEEWYGAPGEHYTGLDPRGGKGPYAYNGGLCECH